MLRVRVAIDGLLVRLFLDTYLPCIFLGALLVRLFFDVLPSKRGASLQCLVESLLGAVVAWNAF